MKYSIEIENIKCGGCMNSIKKAVLKTKDVSNVEVNSENGIVSFEALDDLSKEAVINSLDKIGYPLKNEGNFLQTAKSYVSCAIGRMTSDADAQQK